ncbi:MAG TPA: hypothetical protein VK906_05980 [Egicoccus sp.]|nr:hypothetical protein [Egicoccus sp.]HSK22701.1 hypothetical protein [Egicoccus sp.]
MRLRAFPSHLLQAGVAPLAAVTLIAVGASGTTVLTTPAAQSTGRPAAQTQVLTATPAVDDVLAAPVLSSVSDLEAEAVGLADEFGAVPVDESGRLCPVNELEVRWSEPEGFTHGAFIAPVGPRPADGVEDVNGVVVCGMSTWAFMGFEAAHDGAAWTVTAVPYVNEEVARPEDLNLDAEVDDHADEPATEPTPAKPSPTPSPKPTVETSAWLAGLGAIEPYAAYEPQSACSPTAKAGTVTMKDALLASYPVTRNLGIARACHLGGRSEHKEGRAFDWGAYVSRAGERASVEQFLTQLLATDADGNRHALARRMGVMYVIWNGQIWSAYRPGDGWRRYGGPNPHTDHAHVSLSRAGGAGQTSFFAQGLAAKGVLREVPPGASAINTAAVIAAPSGAARVTTVSARPTEKRQRDAQASVGDSARPARRDGREPFTAEQRAAWEAYQQAAEAERQARREQRRTAEDGQRSEWRERRQETEAQQRTEWQARREAAEAQQRAERQARREAETAKRAEWQQRRAEAEAQQRAEWQARREAETAKRAEWQQRRQEAETAKRAERQRRKEAAETAWRERRQRRQPAPAPSPTPSPSPSPSPTPEPVVTEAEPVVTEPEPVVTEPAPTEGG